MGHFYAWGAEAGAAGRGLRAVRTVGIHLHAITIVGSKGRVRDGLGVDDHAVDQRVVLEKFHGVVVHVSCVGDIHRGGGGSDAGQVHSLSSGATQYHIGIRGGYSTVQCKIAAAAHDH